MDNYLGEVVVDVKDTEFANYTIKDWAAYWLTGGQIDGQHHLRSCIDSTMRILYGTEIIVKRASWGGGHSELRVTLGEPSEGYKEFVKEYEQDGEYSWDIGIPG